MLNLSSIHKNAHTHWKVVRIAVDFKLFPIIPFVVNLQSNGRFLRFNSPPINALDSDGNEIKVDLIILFGSNNQKFQVVDADNVFRKKCSKN